MPKNYFQRSKNDFNEINYKIEVKYYVHCCSCSIATIDAQAKKFRTFSKITVVKRTFEPFFGCSDHEFGNFRHFSYNFSISSKIASSNFDFEIIISRIYGISPLGSSTLRTYDSNTGSKPFNLFLSEIRNETKHSFPYPPPIPIFFEFRYMNRS